MFTVKALLRLEDSTETIAQFATLDEAMQFAKQYRDGPFLDSSKTEADSKVVEIYDWIDGWFGPSWMPFAQIVNNQMRPNDERQSA